MKRLLMLFVCLCLLTGCAQAEEGASLVSVFVGKADCHLLFVGDQVFMIDTGLKESWGKVSRALASLGVDHLSGVLLTHTHKDHAGGLMALASSDLPVDAWYGSACYTDVKEGKHPLVQAAALRGQEVQWLRGGDTIPLENGSTLRVLGPLSLDEEQENNNSLVLRLDSPEGSMLLTGDLEMPGEERLLRAGAIQQADVLKVGHHGEGDATSETFVLAVRPRVAVISTSTPDEPDTPDPDTLRALDAAGAQVVQTQEVDGAVRVTLTGGMPQVELVTFTPPPVTAQVEITDKSVAQDMVTLRNQGSETVDLSGWFLFSEKGKEVFVFPQGTSLAPGASCTVGTLSSEDPGDLLWQEKRVWNEKKPDAAVLYDVYGQQVSRRE